MRNIYQVLYLKERELETVRRHVEVLRVVLPLLEDDDGTAVNSGGVPVAVATVIPFQRPSGLALNVQTRPARD